MPERSGGHTPTARDHPHQQHPKKKFRRRRRSNAFSSNPMIRNIQVLINNGWGVADGDDDDGGDGASGDDGTSSGSSSNNEGSDRLPPVQSWKKRMTPTRRDRHIEALRIIL
mmetsp:Transcript_5054/g.11028  ORF Transcript_5054/g.11028 Transcript_5054/m.11028 type:complete len:112 (-) Transcript_5054:1509-1844(-)